MSTTSTDGVAVAAAPGRRRLGLNVGMRDAGTLFGLLAIVIVFAVLSPNFLTERNLLNVLQQSSINACVALGMTLVIIAGGIDLSVGPTAAIAAVVAAVLMTAGVPIALAIPAALAFGAVAGMLNGALVKTTVVGVVDAQGRRVWAGKCASTPEAIGATVRAKAPGATRVGLETGPLSTWLYHGLKALGVPVVCLDARHAKAALSMQINKSDRNDAEGLAQIVRTGWYREVHVKSEATHLVRTLLRTRLQLTDMRRDVSNQIRGSLKTFGVVLPKAGGRRLEQVAREAAEGRPELQAFVLPLLAAWRALGAEADALD